MGDFRIEIEATGGHGCDRDAKEGMQVHGCGRMGCPDCELRRFLNSPGFKGTLKSARLVHWPGQTTEVVDEYKPVQYGVEATRVKNDFFGGAK